MKNVDIQYFTPIRWFFLMLRSMLSTEKFYIFGTAVDFDFLSLEHF